MRSTSWFRSIVWILLDFRLNLHATDCMTNAFEYWNLPIVKTYMDCNYLAKNFYHRLLSRTKLTGSLVTCINCMRLDKAANNCCFIYIKDIRLSALERLSSPDFQPCKDDAIWLLPSHMLDRISRDLTLLLPEFHIQYKIC